MILAARTPEKGQHLWARGCSGEKAVAVTVETGGVLGFSLRAASESGAGARPLPSHAQDKPISK